MTSTSNREQAHAPRNVPRRLSASSRYRVAFVRAAATGAAPPTLIDLTALDDADDDAVGDAVGGAAVIDLTSDGGGDEYTAGFAAALAHTVELLRDNAELLPDGAFKNLCAQLQHAYHTHGESAEARQEREREIIASDAHTAHTIATASAD